MSRDWRVDLRIATLFTAIIACVVVSCQHGQSGSQSKSAESEIRMVIETFYLEAFNRHPATAFRLLAADASCSEVEFVEVLTATQEALHGLEVKAKVEGLVLAEASARATVEVTVAQSVVVSEEIQLVREGGTWRIKDSGKCASALPEPILERTPSAKCERNYPTICVPPFPPKISCSEIPFKDFPVLFDDPHDFDIDQDGRGCESER